VIFVPVKRNITIKIRLTEEEKEILEQRMRYAGLKNREAYLRKAALKGYILRLDTSDLREALRLLSNATSNINQVAKVANETRSIYIGDVIQLQEEVGNMRSQMSDVMKTFMEVRKLLEL
jgi:hypothetical protein